jgi:hypothetical protein
MLFPVWITTLPKFDNWDYHYDNLLKQDLYNRSLPWECKNFPLKDDSGVWDNVYNQFVDRAEQIFGPLTIKEQNSKTCWCYTSNKEHYDSCIHDHTRTSILNGVYYFYVPEEFEYRDSSISFYDELENEIWNYKPRTNDLIIFPNYLKHQPLPTKSEKYRIAINMEIVCEWPDILNGQK